MAYEQKDGYGALFKQTKPGRAKGAPEYTGEVKVFGKKCQLAGWIKESKSGTKYINLKITPDNAEGNGGRPDDDPPF